VRCNGGTQDCDIKTVLFVLRITDEERMLGTGDAKYILNPETLVRAHVTPDTSTVTCAKDLTVQARVETAS
jgi:hypothetical protein